MQRLSRLLFTISAVSLAAACETAPVLPEDPLLENLLQQPPDYTAYDRRRAEDKENAQAIGLSIAGVSSYSLAEVVKEQGVIRDDNLEAGLGGIYREVTPDELEADLPDTHVYVTTDQLGLEARALETGDVVVKAGTLQNLEHPDEVAFIMAHEASHILLDHFATQERKERIDQAIGGALAVAVMVDSIRNGSSYNAGGTASDELNTALALSAAAAVTNSVLAEAFKQANEIEADQLGIELMHGALEPYSPVGATSVADRLITARVDELERVKVEIAEYNATMETRCGERQDMASQFLTEVFTDALEAELGSNIKTHEDPVCEQWHSIAGRMQDRNTKTLEQRVTDLEERRALMYQYVDLRYGSMESTLGMRPKYASNVVNEFSSNGDVARTLKAQEVEAYLADDNCPAALDLASSTLNGEDDTNGRIRFVNFKAETQCGVDNAIRHLIIAHDAYTSFLAMYPFLIAHYEAEKDYPKVLEMLQSAQTMTPDPQGYYAEIIRVARLSGDDTLMQDTLEKCRQLERGSKPIKEACEAAAIPPEDEAPESEPATDGPAEDGAAGEPEELAGSATDAWLDSMSFEVFATAMAFTDMGDVLRQGGAYAVYAPTDAALANYVGGDPHQLLAYENRDELLKVVNAHVVSLDAAASPLPDTQVGHDQATINKAVLDQLDAVDGYVLGNGLEARDGTLYLVDTVLLTTQN